MVWGLPAEAYNVVHEEGDVLKKRIVWIMVCIVCVAMLFYVSSVMKGL